MTQQAALQRMIRNEKDKAHPTKNRYGVVFVHGVGSQSQSSALREQADPLIRWLRSWHADAAKESGAGAVRGKEFGVVWSYLSYGADIDAPAHLRLHIPAYDLPAQRKAAAEACGEWREKEALKHKTKETKPRDDRYEHYDSQTWILTEGWWAARLQAPDFRKMLGWSKRTVRLAVRRLVRAFEMHEAGPIYRTVGLRQFAARHWTARAIEWLSGRLVVGLYSVVGVLLTPVVWLLALIAQIPIPGLENFVVFKLIRPLVFEGIGDVYTYLYDDVQGLHMRRSLEEAVTWLVQKEQCEHVIVVAHSGGAAIAYDALGNRGAESGCKHDVPDYKCVRALVTVGGALNNAWLHGVGPEIPLRLGDNLCKHTRWTDIWSAYDLVAGGSIAHDPEPDMDVTVTNSLSVLADHGGYWENTEEYLPRIAQLIESPDNRHRSRFWDPIRVEWAEQRRDRVTTAVGWRLSAFALFGTALVAKLINLSTTQESGDLIASATHFIDGRIAADGRRIVDIVGQIPVIGGAIDGLTEVMTTAPAILQVLGADIVGLLMWGAISALSYLAVVRLVFEPWAEREARRSILPPIDSPPGSPPDAPVEPPVSQMREIAVRSTIVLVTLAALAYGVGTLNLNDMTFEPLIVIAVIVGLWLLAWDSFGKKIGPPMRRPKAAPAPATR